NLRLPADFLQMQQTPFSGSTEDVGRRCHKSPSPELVPGVHVSCRTSSEESRGWPEQVRPRSLERRSDCSVKVRLHLLAQELQRFHDALMRDLCAAIHLAQYAVEAKRLLQSHQAICHPLGRADDDLVAQRFVIGDRLQP